jgi:hypothetical protein
VKLSTSQELYIYLGLAGIYGLKGCYLAFSSPKNQLFMWFFQGVEMREKFGILGGPGLSIGCNGLGYIPS